VESAVSSDLHAVRVAAKRLERYSRKVKDEIWCGDRRKLIDALADVAEASEIARRLYDALAKVIRGSR
jgi:hypothetical protein